MSKGGGGGGGGSQTVRQEIDPDVKAAYLTNLDFARNVGNQLGVRQFAGFDPTYQMGEAQALAAGVGPGRQQLGTAGQLTQAAAGFTPTAIRPDQELIQQYYNPFQQQVIDTTMQDIERQRQMASMGLGQQATAARAFGGSRQGVAEGVLAGEAARAAAQTSAG